MNVLSDILCDSSSLMVPQNYNGPLLSHNKILPSHNTIVTSKKGSMHLLDTLSNISDIGRPMNVLNNSSPASIDIFNTSDHQVHLSSSLESNNFHDGSQVSAFNSNSFHEMVPPWLTHDFMKVSDNIPSPEMLTNVSDIYPCTRENENLEMLDLGFPPELTSQDMEASALNRTHIINTQKLLAQEPMQRYSTADSLLISSFHNMNNSHLQMPVSKSSASYQKFKHSSPQSIMNAVLPCENDLLHLPLSSSITDECLNSSSSPSILPRNQSQTHPVDIVCDKLPHINLNQLDTLLGNESTLSTIQLMHHDFPNVRIPDDVECESHLNPTQTCIDNCNPNRNGICNTENFQSTNMTSLSHSHDISVQVSESLPQPGFLANINNCLSCTRVPLDSPLEITQCFKCKFCDFVSLHKCSVANHISLSHSKSQEIGESVATPVSREENSLNRRSDDNIPSTMLPGEGQNANCTSKSIALVAVSNASLVFGTENNSWTQLCAETDYTSTLIKVVNNNFACNKCDKVFSDLDQCKSHLISLHGIKLEYLNLGGIKSNDSNSQSVSISVNGQLTASNEILTNKTVPTSVANSSKLNIKKSARKKVVTPIRRVAPKKVDDVEKGNENKKTKNVEPTLQPQEKKLSSHKEAWRKKMKRELGSYICEFKGCNVRFRALDNLEYHKKCHVSGGNTFACPECETTFENWRVIAGHLWRIHSNDMELHACDQCSFRTYSLGRLENIHKRIHLDECLFLCDTCGKSFKNGKQLRNHRVIHLSVAVKVKVKPDVFNCVTCHSQFTSKRLLQLHQNNAHNKQNLHMCNYCEYTTMKRSTLKMHMRQHTGEKPFSCDKCEYRTSDHNSLRRHKMKHSGEKPYKCPYCSYGSIQASSYKAHLKNQHPDQNDGLMFSCNRCSFRTVKQDTYLDHILEHEQLDTPAENTSNSLPEPIINEDAEMFSLVEAMDISLSHGDNTFLSHLNKDKINIQSFLRNLNINMTAVYEDGVM